MRVQHFPEPRLPEDIPIAGVTLLDLLGEGVPADEVQLALSRGSGKNPDVMIQLGDEFRRFRTPTWTWAAMAGVEGVVVLRSGRVVFWVVTRMN
ncbi:hypothetical protein TA3x_000649 [Tundrisphaera sp. TA3]|uniref:hypothetical protein n=1 Tax=Tundrisphaera sp. TA3 TaxID=3435775 RepID=UPI003EBF39AC